VFRHSGNQSNHIVPWFQEETDLDGLPRLRLALRGVLPPVHAKGAHVAVEIFSIAIEDGGDESQFIPLLSVEDAKRKLREVDAGLHRESGNGGIAFDGLDPHLDGQIVRLAAREKRLLHLAFRGIFCGRILTRCKVSAASGDRQSLTAIQRNFESM
jgi:hypothetical protein